MTPTPTERDSLVARLLERANTMNGVQPVGAGDGNTYVTGYYTVADAKLDREAAAALSRPEQVVKALEWKHPWHWVAEDTSKLEGRNHEGVVEYAISLWDDGQAHAMRLNSPLNFSEVFGNVESAKAAAQADYEQRILAALHPAPEAASAGAAATCATEGCEQPATCRFERKGVGSVYCGECFGRIVEAVDRPSDTAPSPKGVQEEVHPDDLAVDRFAAAMKAKLAKKRAEGRGGWEDATCNAGILSQLLREHVEKGDPLDVGNLSMMLHQRGERIAAPSPKGVSDGVRERIKTFLCVRESARADDYPWSQLNDATDILRDIEAALSQEPVPATAEERAASVARTALTRAESSLGAGMEGWQLVPKEPTPEMLGAWYRYKNGHRWPGEEPARDTSDFGAYRAMLSAAPRGESE